jgi:hypothetical protein
VRARQVDPSCLSEVTRRLKRVTVKVCAAPRHIDNIYNLNIILTLYLSIYEAIYPSI